MANLRKGHALLAKYYECAGIVSHGIFDVVLFVGFQQWAISEFQFLLPWLKIG